jgi:xanthine dehydrogenase YagR molybdenum-binding subunit
MRAPGDAIGLLALECAMDELADALRLDPAELRLRNDTQVDQERTQPFASRHLTRRAISTACIDRNRPEASR